jgi:hypothetical protein
MRAHTIATVDVQILEVDATTYNVILKVCLGRRLIERVHNVASAIVVLLAAAVVTSGHVATHTL